MTQKTQSRRTMLRVLGTACGTMAVLPIIGCGSGGGESAGCNDMTGVDVRTRTALSYTPNAPDATRHCSGCTLYVAPTGGACGTCQAFPGPVEATGTCNSFVARS